MMPGALTVTIPWLVGGPAAELEQEVEIEGLVYLDDYNFRGSPTWFEAHVGEIRDERGAEVLWPAFCEGVALHRGQRVAGDDLLAEVREALAEAGAELAADYDGGER